MSILWAGGEDIDFPNGSMPYGYTTAGYFRSSYARCGLAHQAPNYGSEGRSNAFSGGAVTACWFSLRLYLTTGQAHGIRFAGVGKSGTLCGVWVGGSTSAETKIAISTWDGSTATELAAEDGNSLPSNSLYKIDVQITDFGEDTNIKVYVNGTGSPVIDYTGDATLTGMTELDCALVQGQNYYSQAYISEVIVADEDTRTFNLLTLAPSGAGDTTDWTGAYTDIDEINNSDADCVYVNTIDKDIQTALTDTPAGNFLVKAVIVSARCSRTNDSTPTKVKLGIKTGGTVNVGTGQSLTTGWDTYCRIMATNPVTTSVFNTTELDALQLDLQSSA